MEIKNCPIPKSIFSGIDSIKGTRLDLDSKNSIWESVTPKKMRMKEDVWVKQEDLQGIPKDALDKFRAVLHEAEDVAFKKLAERRDRYAETVSRLESIMLVNALSVEGMSKDDRKCFDEMLLEKVEEIVTEEVDNRDLRPLTPKRRSSLRRLAGFVFKWLEKQNGEEANKDKKGVKAVLIQVNNQYKRRLKMFSTVFSILNEGKD